MDATATTGGVSDPMVRRRAMLRAAGVGASLVWTVPLVQAVTLDAAQAASSPPKKVPPKR